MDSHHPNSSTVPPLRALVGVMLVPLIAVFGLGLISNYTQLVLAAYVVQTVIWLFYYQREGVALSVGWALFGILISISHVLSLVASSGIFGSLNWMDVADAGARVIGFFFYVGLASRLCLNVRGLESFFRFLVLVGVLSVVGSLILSPPWEILFTSASSYAVNFGAFFASRNQLGGFLFVAIAALILVRANFQRRVTFYFAFGLLMSGLLMTMSRSAIGATFVMLFVLVVVQAPFTRFPAIVMGGLGVGAYLRSNDRVWSQVDRMFVRSESGVTGRDELWSHGLRLFRESPVFGVGGFQAVDEAQAAGMINDQFHSFYVEALASGGVVGLIIRGGIILFVCLRVIGAWRRREEGADLYLGAFAGLIFMMIFESVSFLSIGYVDTLFSVFFVFVPLAVFNSAPRSQVRYASESSQVQCGS